MLAAAAAVLAAAGCVTESVERGDPSVLLPGRPGAGPTAGGDAAIAGIRPGRRAGVRDAGEPRAIRPIPGFEDAGPLGRRVPVFTAGVRAEVQPRGTIPFDEQTLPLVSPDGTRMAVPAGLPPRWPQLLAEPGAESPDGGVMIFDLASDEPEAPAPAAPLREPVLLGRAASDEGFLVEAPRPDGARWIGLADWDTGAIEWLVTSEPGVVDAFATLGPDGWMAWSRRRPGDDRFTLVVRDPEGREREAPARAGSWLMPRFALDGTPGLFALVLDGGRLDAVHLDPSAGAAMMATLRRTPLATEGADVGTAYQVLAPDAALVTDRRSGPAPPARLFLVHPAHGRAAVWHPDRALPDLLDPGSFAAVVDHEDPRYCLVSMGDHLVRRAVDERRDRIRVVAGAHVPRPTRNPRRSYVLLQPAGSVLGVTLLRFEPVGDVIGE